MKNAISKLSYLLHRELHDLEELMQNSLHNDCNLLTDIISHILSSKGKKIRPMIAIATSRLLTPNVDKKVFSISLALELIHTATLLHDDVIDDSKERRNIKTSNYIWGNKASILVGDFLFSKSFDSMINTENIEVLKILSNTSSEIAKAELWQLEIIEDYTIKTSDYIQLITSKTAKLFSSACQCSAILSTAKKEQSISLYGYGINFGIAFQLIDDIRDYFATPSSLGKSNGSDFYEGKITLPLILLIQHANKEDLSFIESLYKGNSRNSIHFDKIKSLMIDYKIPSKSQEFLEKYVHLAIKNIDSFQESDIKKELINLALELHNPEP